MNASNPDDNVHPAWCARTVPGCTGRWHRSREVVVPADEVAGIGVRLAIIGHAQRAFFELMMRPASRWPVAGNPSTFPSSVVAASILEDPEDPLYITDPHAHDLTVDQAQTLHSMLGELLALARSNP